MSEKRYKLILGDCLSVLPSLDHIHPQAKKGSWNLENLQFLTWFENRAKADMSQEEWGKFKRETNTRSDLFIDSILNEKSNF